MIFLLVFGSIAGYLAIGGSLARTMNERRWSNDGVGRTFDPGRNSTRDRTFNEEVDHHIGVGLAITVFWPFVIIGLALGGLILGGYHILRHLLVPGDLRSRVG